VGGRLGKVVIGAVVAVASAVGGAVSGIGPTAAAVTTAATAVATDTLAGESADLSAVVLADGRVRAVGVDSVDRARIRIVDHDGNGGRTGTSSVAAPGGAGLREPRGVVATGDRVVAQFATDTGFALVAIGNTGKLWEVADSLGSCGNGDGEIADLAVSPVDGSLYSTSWNFLGNTPPQCDGTGIRKYRADGTRVAGWGATTFEGTAVDNRIEANAVTVAGDGTVVVAGVRFAASGDLEQVAALKLTASGARVAGFGVDGLASFQPGVAHQWWGAVPGFSRVASSKGALDVAVDSAGRIVLVGAGVRPGHPSTDIWVARLTANGQLDQAFGTGGVVHVDLGGTDDYGLRVAVDALDRVVVAGVRNDGPVSAGTDNRAEFTTRLTASGVWDSGATRFSARPASRYLPHHLVLGPNRVVTSGALRDEGAGYVAVRPLDTGSSGGGNPPRLFTGVTPWRALDTRDNGLALVAGQPRAVLVTGGGVPDTAVAVALNVTVVAPTEGGYLGVYPGVVPPLASSLNFTPGQTIANALVVGIDSGFVSLSLGAGSAHVVIDVMGWFGPAQNFVPITPARAVDTRSTRALAPYETRTFAVTAPGAATAVTLNITAVDATAGGHLRAWPGTGAEPLASVLNFSPGQTIANALTVGVDGSGRISVRNHSDGPVHLVVDVTGRFTGGAAFNPVTPVRAHDSRDSRALDPWELRTVKVTGLPGVPGDGRVRGVVVNVTVTAPTGSGFVSAVPGGAPPGTSLLNFTPGVDIANGALLGVGPGGTIDVRNSLGSTHVVVDVLGWF